MLSIFLQKFPTLLSPTTDFSDGVLSQGRHVETQFQEAKNKQKDGDSSEANRTQNTRRTDVDLGAGNSLPAAQSFDSI